MPEQNVTRQHLPGLQLALERWNDGGPSVQYAHLLTDLIAQASAQPASVSVPENEVRKVVTDAMVSMVASVTGLVPPSGPGAIPDFVQSPIDRAVTQITKLLSTAQHPVSGEQRAAAPEGITIERDFVGTMHIKVGDFDYVQVRYQYPYTDNAGTRRLAEQIAKLIAGQPAAQDVAGDVLAEWIEHGPSRPCPFTHPYSSKVDIRLRDGTEKLGELACNVTWFWYAHEHRDYHVVAYRPAAHRAQQTDHSVAVNKMVEGQQ